ncbi:MAG: hypothetical protein JXR29_05140 [Methylothermaceae bacterium]|nr:hypothetical protein [Methylothermaceae bacterium]
MIRTNESMIILTHAEMDEMIRKTASIAANEALKRIKSTDQDDLWDAEQVGKYLKVSTWTVQNKLAYMRGFPKAVYLGDGPKAPRRWRAGDIKKWTISRKK